MAPESRVTQRRAPEARSSGEHDSPFSREPSAESAYSEEAGLCGCARFRCFRASAPNGVKLCERPCAKWP